MIFMKQIEILAAASILDENFLRDLITQILIGLLVIALVIWALYGAVSKILPNLDSWKIVLLVVLISAALTAGAGLITQQLGL